LAVEILHSLNQNGLTVEVLATNIGTVTLPWGYGAHPYFRFDDLAGVELTVPFDAELAVDAERLLPLRLGPVQDAHQFSEPRRIGDTVLDTAYTDPFNRHWGVTLQSEGRRIEVWGEATTQWVQVFTAPTRASIAVEPMTCGPNAFNEGPTYRDRVVLRAGESARAVWGVAASA
ncbi:MAG: aldose epimerase, partial [Propionibacteriaceae bacterium]|nr:aldose epimerase [Propionibacteriaceae bacterium]